MPLSFSITTGSSRRNVRKIEFKVEFESEFVTTRLWRPGQRRRPSHLRGRQTGLPCGENRIQLDAVGLFVAAASIRLAVRGKTARMDKWKVRSRACCLANGSGCEGTRLQMNASDGILEHCCAWKRFCVAGICARVLSHGMFCYGRAVVRFPIVAAGFCQLRPQRRQHGHDFRLPILVRKFQKGCSPGTTIMAYRFEMPLSTTTTATNESDEEKNEEDDKDEDLRLRATCIYDQEEMRIYRMGG